MARNVPTTLAIIDDGDAAVKTNGCTITTTLITKLWIAPGID
jgi:hypothetical protein